MLHLAIVTFTVLSAFSLTSCSETPPTSYTYNTAVSGTYGLSGTPWNPNSAVMASSKQDNLPQTGNNFAQRVQLAELLSLLTPETSRHETDTRTRSALDLESSSSMAYLHKMLADYHTKRQSQETSPRQGQHDMERNPVESSHSFSDLYDFHPDTRGFTNPEREVPLNVFGLPPKHRFQHPVGNVESAKPAVVSTNADLPGPVVDSGVMKGSGHYEDNQKFQRLYNIHPDTEGFVNPEKNVPLNVFGLPSKHRFQSPHGNVNSFRPPEVQTNANLAGPVVDVLLNKPNLASSFSGKAPITSSRTAISLNKRAPPESTTLLQAYLDQSLQPAINYLKLFQPNNSSDLQANLKNTPNYTMGEMFADLTQLFSDSSFDSTSRTPTPTTTTTTGNPNQKMLGDELTSSNIQPSNRTFSLNFAINQPNDQPRKLFSTDSFSLIDRPLTQLQNTFHSDQLLNLQQSQDSPSKGYATKNDILSLKTSIERYLTELLDANSDQKQHAFPSDVHFAGNVDAAAGIRNNDNVFSSLSRYPDQSTPMKNYQLPSEHSTYSYQKPQNIHMAHTDTFPSRHFHPVNSQNQFSNINYQNHHHASYRNHLQPYVPRRPNPVHQYVPVTQNKVLLIHDGDKDIDIKFDVPQQQQQQALANMPGMNQRKTIVSQMAPAEMFPQSHMDYTHGQHFSPMFESRPMSPHFYSVAPDDELDSFAPSTAGFDDDQASMETEYEEPTSSRDRVSDRHDKRNRRKSRLLPFVKEVISTLVSEVAKQKSNLNQHHFWPPTLHDREEYIPIPTFEESSLNLPASIAELQQHQAVIEEKIGVNQSEISANVTSNSTDPFDTKRMSRDVYYAPKIQLSHTSPDLSSAVDYHHENPSHYAESYMPASRRGAYYPYLYNKKRLLFSLLPKAVKFGIGLGVTKEISLDYPQNGYSYYSPNKVVKVKLGAGPFIEKEVKF